MSSHSDEKLKQAIKDTGSYTPGPWKLFKSWDARPHAIFLRKGIAFVEVMHYGYDDYDGKISREQLANAHLISAAPDLLESLLVLLDRYTSLANCGDCGNWDCEKEESVISARLAIAKATDNKKDGA